jgi:hypothetical protein
MSEDNEKTIQQEYTDDVSADLAAAIAEVEGAERGEDGKFVAKDKEEETAPVEPVAAEPVKEIPPPPQSWGESVKQSWASLPDDVRASILKREADAHKEFTAPDGALRLGREVKEIVTPYMAQIQAEGATAPQAIASLLNTAHILRTGTPEQKKALILNTAKQFGVDIGAVQEEQEYVDPTIAQLKSQVEELKRLADPNYIRSTLTKEMESTKIQSDIAAFASNSANVHFETVKPLMASILNAGQAKDLKEAYDMACMANPTIRSTLEAAKAAETEAKRKQEIMAKKRAASSVTGSSAVPSNAKATNPKSSVEDDLRAVFDELETRV